MIGLFLELVITIALIVCLANVSGGFVTVLVFGVIALFLFSGGWGQGG